MNLRRCRPAPGSALCLKAKKMKVSLESSGTVATDMHAHSRAMSPLDTRVAAPAACEQPVRATTPMSPVLQDADGIDPVEKVLSMSHASDMWLMEDDVPAQPLGTSTPSFYPNLSYNFQEVMNESLRRHYLNMRRSQMEIHHANSLFSVLTNPPQTSAARSVPREASRSQVPFFRNVNFNPTSAYSNRLDEYIHYDDDEVPLTTELTDSEHDEPAEKPAGDEALSPLDSVMRKSKMSFHYRQNDVGLSLTDGPTKDVAHDVFKYLNQRSVMLGKASEVIGTPNFLITDFFF